MSTKASSACLIYEGPANDLHKVIENFYHKFVVSGVKNVVVIILTNDGLEEVLPRLRDVLLNNIALGIKIYMFSYDEADKVRAELVRVLSKDSIGHVYVYSLNKPSLLPEICVIVRNYGVGCEVVE